ncbi:lipoprotein, partial [Bacillus thuringiensis]|nr:lipoprotein [Bacillus thuringiensis]
KGSFVKNSNVYHIDYGNSFTSEQTLKVADGTLNVYFLTAEKLCTYKKK